MAWWILAGLLAAAYLALLRLWLYLQSSVSSISRTAERLARGDYGARVGELPLKKLAALGSKINLLAERFESAIDELSREKAQLSAILANMVEAVVAVDAERRIAAVNPALTSLFGVPQAQAQGRPFLEALRHNQLDGLLRAVLSDKQGRSEEVRLFAPDERIFEAHAVFLGGEGAQSGALLVLHEISRIRKLEQMRRDFVANVSHELRTPLASIKGFAETLRAGAMRDDAHREEFLAEIEESANRLTALVDDLLDLSAIESGQRPPNIQEIALPEVILEVAASLKPVAERRRVSIEAKPAQGLPRVKADRNQLKQVLTNLIDNAVKFNREAGRVTVSASALGRLVSVSIQDTGPGIPEQDLPRVFERFYRVDKARSRELGGTGLGLSIVKHIIEAHGGTVSVESKLSAGSTFSFTLPAA